MSSRLFRVDIPETLSIYDYEPNDHVSFDVDKRCFWIKTGTLSAYDFQQGKINVFVKFRDDIPDDRNYECWKDIQLDIRGMPGAIKLRAETQIGKIDPSSAIAKCSGAVVASYKEIFNQYLAALRLEAEWIKSFPVEKPLPKGKSTFSELYAQQDSPPKDVAFDCDDGEVRGHKFVLTATCASLKPTFKDSSDIRIRVEGVARGAFEKLIRYLYTGIFELTDAAEACQIYRYAKLYQIEGVARVCKAGYCDEMLRALDASHLMAPEALQQKIQEEGFERIGPLFQEAVNKVDRFKRKLALFHGSL